MTRPSSQSRAPRLIFKALGVSFFVTASVLAAVLLLLSWQTRERLTAAVAKTIDSSQERFSILEGRRQRERRLQAAALAESPTLKAALDTYQSEARDPASAVALRRTLQAELEKLQARLDVPALSVIDVRGQVIASAGPEAGSWAPGSRVPLLEASDRDTTETVVARGARHFFATVVPLQLGDDTIGDFCLASPIDETYARTLAAEAQTDTAVLIGGRLIAGSIAPDVQRALERVALPAAGAATVAGHEFAVRRLWSVGEAQIYALGDVGAARRTATDEAGRLLLVVGIGALLLAGAGSWWLARHLASPIESLRRTLHQMAEARDFERPLPQTGTSFEVDALTATFDSLRQAVSEAEAESEATYLGVIRALAAALDARDPYTAGHSERVADLSVAIGRQMLMPDPELEVLRLGALLHDIGKIGISDAVLRKPGTLTDEEFEQIKRHPELGARILKPLHFLGPHLAIVELHHEQPDGLGYPHGLRGHQIPLAARIVHVADAFDAITNARAYRPGRPATEAMAELWQHAGTGFDLDVVRALAAIPTSVLMTPPAAVSASPAGHGALVPFRVRSTAVWRRTAG